MRTRRCKTRGRTHSREFKLTIVRQLASGEKRPAQVRREHNLAASLVARWRQEYETRGEAAFAAPDPTPTQVLEAKVTELERFCGQLAWENAILKKRCNTFRHATTRGDHASEAGESTDVHPFQVCPNLMKGLQVDAPDLAWVADITYIRQARTLLCT